MAKAESLRASEERQMGEPINHCNLKCSMSERSVDTIVSAIYLMMERSSKNTGRDFSEIVRQFLCDLTIPEQREFWNELRALHSARNSADRPSVVGLQQFRSDVHIVHSGVEPQIVTLWTEDDRSLPNASPNF